MVKLRKVTIKALPENMPESITLDISGLNLGKSVKVGDIDVKDFEIQNSVRVTIATVDIPRALKAADDEEEEGEEGEEGDEGAEGAEGSSEGASEGSAPAEK